jgi:hypothetical protein
MVASAASVLKLKAVDHPVKSVTIFKSRTAEVVRTFSLELQVSHTSAML